MGFGGRWLGAALLATATPCVALEPHAEILVRGGGRLSCLTAAPAAAAALLPPGDAPVHVLTGARDALAGSAGLHIVLRGTDQLEAHPEAKAAFLRAAARWESLVASPVSIVIDVDYGSTIFGHPWPSDAIAGLTATKEVELGWGIVRSAFQSPGRANAALYAHLPPSAVPTDVGPSTRIVASAPVFRALGLLPAVEDPSLTVTPFGSPAQIAFQAFSDIDFDFTDGIDAGAGDFDFLASHEIGHVLGFGSQVGVRTPASTGPVILGLMDLFRFRPSSDAPDLSATPRVLSEGGAQVFWFGAAQIPLSTGIGAFPKGDFGAAHWRSAIFGGVTVGVMEPLEQPGARGVVTSRDLALLGALGWQIAGAAPSEPSSRTVPIVLDAAGVRGSRFSTELTLTNRSMAAADIELAFTPAAALGATGGGLVTTTLSALSQTLIPDALAWLREHGAPIPTTGNQGGTLRVTFRGDATPDSFFAGARTTSPAGGGRAGLAYPAIRDFDGLRGRSYVFGLRENAADRSNLALLNMGSAPVALRVTLHSGAGDGATTILSDVTLDAGQWMQLSRVLTGPGYANGWAVLDLVSGIGPYGAYAVFNDNATNDGSYVPAVPDPLAAEPQLVPVIVETPTFSSELILANPSGTACTVSLDYAESATPAMGAGGSATVLLAPYEQRILPSAVDWLRTHGVSVGARGATYAGTVTITFATSGAAAVGLAGARTSAAGDGGAYGTFTPAVGRSGGFRWDTWVFGLRQDASSRSNLAVINTGDEHAPLTLHVEVFDGVSGARIGQTPSFTLAPGGWTQFGGILGGFGLANGYARIVYDAGSGSFLAYGVVNDGATAASGGTNDGSYIAAAKR